VDVVGHSSRSFGITVTRLAWIVATFASSKNQLTWTPSPPVMQEQMLLGYAYRHHP
jgi:hypothetical protein